MKLSRSDADVCNNIAEYEDVAVSEVRKAVSAYFDSIVSDARKLPFNNPQRIYTKPAFEQQSFVVNLPYLGRIGPVYSRYLKWRREEAKEFDHVERKKVRQIYAAPIIEEEAKKALAGQKASSTVLRERIPKGKYNKVWMMHEGGLRRAAKQLIVNNKHK